MARALELTQAELDILHNAPGANPPPTGAGGRLWVLATEEVEEPSSVVYVFDAPGPAMQAVGDNAGANWAIPLVDVDKDPFYKPLPAAP
jgi:hypothetical protein